MRAIVNAPVCPLTGAPRQGAQRVDEVLCGMAVEVLTVRPEWWYIRTPYRYEGWAPAGCLIPVGAAGGWEAMPRRVVFHKNFCDALSAPRFQAEALATLPRGAAVAAAGPVADGWQKIALPDGREGYVRQGILSPYLGAPPDLPERALRERLCRTALLYRGTPYRWGGKTPMGIDCSGLVSMAYLLWGIPIYRDAKIVEGFPVHEISREDMGPADLLFFPGHVAMYLGEGRYCHATGRAGDDGFAVNSLDPAAPGYRADLAEVLTAVGSVF